MGLHNDRRTNEKIPANGSNTVSLFSIFTFIIIILNINEPVYNIIVSALSRIS